MNSIENRLARLSFLWMAAIMSVSCTYDYFEDETNLWIHVPQVETGEISSLYVSFHLADGRHLLTRKITAPFDGDPMMRKGILRFRLDPGLYRASFFADYAPGSIVEARPLYDSYKGQPVEDAARNIYGATASEPRALFIDSVAAYPLGRPEAKRPREANMGDDRRFKGRIECNFRNLPAHIDLIEIFYRGAATKYRFDGVFDGFTPEDVVRCRFTPADHLSGGVVRCVARPYPSVGMGFGAGQYPDRGRNIELDILFRQGEATAGTASLTVSDLASLPPDRRPTDAQGKPVSDLILRPQGVITADFNGFTLVGVTLDGWGEIVTGGFDM
ncbi:MAG: hypothetical protein LBH06_01315 [Rikenellaceae bacterium]|nr:hypothetical protein [Rikenellaceae bacterium]